MVWACNIMTYGLSLTNNNKILYELWNGSMIDIMTIKDFN
jgi:hypothetical protein